MTTRNGATKLDLQWNFKRLFGGAMPENKANKFKLPKAVRERKIYYLKNRRLSKKQISLTYKIKYKAVFLFGNRCLSCGSDKDIQLDHIKPVSLFPLLSFEFSNMQILCKECNIKKSNTSIIDFRPNNKKYELWSKDQKAMFKLLVDKEKIYKPIVFPSILKYKGTLKDFAKGIKEKKEPRKHISPVVAKFLLDINYTLEDVINNRTENYVPINNKIKYIKQENTREKLVINIDDESYKTKTILRKKTLS